MCAYVCAGIHVRKTSTYVYTYLLTFTMICWISNKTLLYKDIYFIHPSVIIITILLLFKIFTHKRKKIQEIEGGGVGGSDHPLTTSPSVQKLTGSLCIFFDFSSFFFILFHSSLSLCLIFRV